MKCFVLIFSLIGPQAWSFQHFIDRLMPDIAQAYDLVNSTKWTVVGPVGKMSENLSIQSPFNTIEMLFRHC